MKQILTIFLLLISVTNAQAEGRSVRYQVNGQSYEGYYITPRSGAPLVLLIHDWDGLNDYEIKRSNMLADLGYAVFAMDLFGAGIQPADTKERQRLTGELYQNRSKMRDLMNGALQEAKAQGADIRNAVAMGYCFGGAAVLEWARSGVDLKGFVTFHGGLATPEGQDYSLTKGQLLILHGTADTSVTMDDFAALAKALETKGISHEMITYSGAPHAFTVFGTDRYRADADRKSWQRFTAFLGDVLK
jgi:dienelactone hydrolase